MFCKGRGRAGIATDPHTEANYPVQIRLPLGRSMMSINVLILLK